MVTRLIRRPSYHYKNILAAVDHFVERHLMTEVTDNKPMELTRETIQEFIYSDEFRQRPYSLYTNYRTIAALKNLIEKEDKDKDSQVMTKVKIMYMWFRQLDTQSVQMEITVPVESGTYTLDFLMDDKNWLKHQDAPPTSDISFGYLAEYSFLHMLFLSIYILEPLMYPEKWGLPNKG
jgi:hypothetical protein